MEDPGIPDPEPARPDGWIGATYNYDRQNAQPHAVLSVDRQQYLGDENPISDTYEYDGNGNMTCRTESNQTWVHTYNAENRISVVEKVTGDCTTHGTTTDTWTFTYDGDGVRVKEVYSGTGDSYTKYYFAGGAYEIEVVGETTTIKRYYSIAGMMVAMKEGTEDPIYFASDHLSSTSIVMNDTGGLLSQNRYMPFGEIRDNIASSPITQTDFGYTGQRNLASIGLMDYKARFYSPTLMRFTQPDTIIGSPSNPQSYNRFSYVYNSPILYNDPLGLYPSCGPRENPHCPQGPTSPPPHYPPPGGSSGGNGGSGSSGGGDSGGGGESDNTPSLTTGTKTCYYYRRGAAPFNGWIEVPCWQEPYFPDTYSMYEGHWIPLVDTGIDLYGITTDVATIMALIAGGPVGGAASVSGEVAASLAELLWAGYIYSEGRHKEAYGEAAETLLALSADFSLKVATKRSRAVPVFGLVTSLYSLHQNIDTIKTGMVEHPQWIELWNGLPPSNPSNPSNPEMK